MALPGAVLGGGLAGDAQLHTRNCLAASIGDLAEAADAFGSAGDFPRQVGVMGAFVLDSSGAVKRLTFAGAVDVIHCGLYLKG